MQIRLRVVQYRDHNALAISEMDDRPWDLPRLIFHSQYRATLTIELVKKHSSNIDLSWDGTLYTVGEISDKVWGIINTMSKIKRMDRDLYDALLGKVSDLDAFESLLTPYAVLDKLSNKDKQ